MKKTELSVGLMFSLLVSVLVGTLVIEAAANPGSYVKETFDNHSTRVTWNFQRVGHDEWRAGNSYCSIAVDSNSTAHILFTDHSIGGSRSTWRATE